MRSPILRLTRVAAWALVGVVALFCVLLLVVRFVAFPRLEAHRDDLALWLSRELEHPVEIDAIVTGWDGWNPEVSVRGLRVRDRAGAALQPLVELPEVTAALAWASLVVGELRLRELRIVKPRLSVRRDRDGRIHVAGFEFDPATTGRPIRASRTGS